MKKLYFFSACLCATGMMQAQSAFWTENFGTGCNRGQLATAYSGSNGSWTITDVTSNGNYANTWFVSATAAGTSAGNCASSCMTASTSNATLHVSNVTISIPSFVNVGADSGASYLSGGFCGFGYCANTDRRVESPLINCTGQSNISLSFVYLEDGDAANDDGSLQFSSDGGSTWTTIDPLAKTPATCGVLGQWTAFSITLPAAADNNPNVKIGFHWVNNDDGTGSDPSFAVDSISLTSMPTGILSNVAQNVNIFSAGNEIIIKTNGQAYKLLGVTNILGQEVGFTQQDNRVQLTNTNPGIYWVSVEVNGERVVKKVMMTE